MAENPISSIQLNEINLAVTPKIHIGHASNGNTTDEANSGSDEDFDAGVNEGCQFHYQEHRGSNLVLHHITGRRGSFLYRQESNSGHSHYSSRHESLVGDETGKIQVDEPIVTPFAQILASLRKVRTNFMMLTNVTSSRDSRFGTVQGLTSDDASNIFHSSPKATASETLEELEWCLERLENIQTHRSVSDMASSKFKKMLNKELSQFADGGQSGKQISEYICSTFLDSKENDSVPIGNSMNNNEEINASVVNTTNTNSIINSTITTNNLKIDLTNDIDLDETVNATNDNTNNILPKLINCTESVNTSDTTNMSNTSNNNNNLPLSLSSKPRISINLPDSNLNIESEITQSPKKIDSIYSLPNGINAHDPEKVNNLLQTSLDCWGMDIFQLAQSTTNPLTCIFYSIVQKRNLIQKFAIPERNLILYMNSIEEHYNQNPYHNRVHAADVVQSTHVLLCAQSLESVFTDLEIFAVLFACAIHDVGHPGVTNQYLVNTNDRLAILYNDSSVLENHHLAIAFSLLSNPGHDMFENFPRKQRQTLRRMIIDMVLATDMSKHMSLLADLKTMVETKKVAGSGILTLENYNDRMQILQNMVHCADLSNPAKPLDLYRQWTGRVMEELFRQGDKERELGLDISPICDRNTATIEKSQVSFIDYIVHPLWETWSDLVYPDAQNILETLEDNREWYSNQIVEECSNKNETKTQ